jgi:hypothetical protein
MGYLIGFIVLSCVNPRRRKNIMKAPLIDRVKKVNSDAKSAGKRYVVLWAECVEHMFGDSHDWTVLATLISGAAPKDAAILRALTGKAIQGFSLVKDKEQATGLRFKKKEDSNQGVDSDFVSKVKELGVQGNVLQGKVIGDLLAKPKVKDEVLPELTPEVRAKKVKAHKATLAKWAEELGVTEAVLLHMLTAKDEPAH